MRGMSRPYMGPLPGSIRALQGRSVSGLVPAWQTMAANLMEHVKASGRTAVGDRRQSRLRKGLV
jgi:hypothetical protein